MGQTIHKWDSLTEEAQNQSYEIFNTGDVHIQEANANLVGGGTTTVEIPKLVVDGDSETLEQYQELREQVASGEADPETAGQLFGETMGALEMRMAGYGELGDYDVAVAFPDGTANKHYDNPLGGSEGKIQDLMGDWAQALEESAGTPESHPAYEMARKVDEDIDHIDPYGTSNR
ncbi:hypothetical protein [Candidatus Nanohalovita haloferacivicina]|uniref:hypothetical protein n=1 Tax=Candidatus Nanohalovita haloferacivicina TaxID=2978046 RepID=UPI00325FDF52|nr:hypothetical protein HBNXNv_0960 [Candidatus Nanohalobia archaeon BNXNv]